MCRKNRQALTLRQAHYFRPERSRCCHLPIRQEERAEDGYNAKKSNIIQVNQVNQRSCFANPQKRHGAVIDLWCLKGHIKLWLVCRTVDVLYWRRARMRRDGASRRIELMTAPPSSRFPTLLITQLRAISGERWRKRKRKHDGTPSATGQSGCATVARARAAGGCAPDAFPIVGLGASAGGLDAFQKFFDALAPGSGMAFILIQHLDPTHQSMMVDLLAGHTQMMVQQAQDGMMLEREHIYIIPPGSYLSIGGGTLRLSRPRERHGARMPFDFFLRSLADEVGERAICVILSGTGADGSLGLKAVKEKGGLVITQQPDEAGFDGMPRSAIATGAVDLVLPVAKIPAVLAKYGRQTYFKGQREGAEPRGQADNALADVIDLLRTRTPHDFTLYKPGTLQRRIERRMAMAAVTDGDRYLGMLQQDARELDLLAKDLLINVTSFFRDPEVFDFLAKEIVPALVRKHTSDRPIRLWVAGCSTGEETYSIAMLFLEEIAAAGSNVKLQVFASDVDGDAVAFARDVLFPETIEVDVSAPRLARFFTKEDHSYRVVPALREV